MSVEDLKWYSPFVLLFGAILSFADPITDILTLVEFYRTGHKTWFGVGLAFILLPCLVSPALFLVFRRDDAIHLSSLYAKTALCAFHPFSAAFARIEAFIFCLKMWWFGGDKFDEDTYDKADNVLNHIAFAVLFEAVLESAPQFIIQLYAISVQEEPAAIIQVISLPVSFLTLAWAFTNTDEKTLAQRNIISSGNGLIVKHKIALYVTHLLLLSSRLFAICYFTVSYKWWVSGILLFHSCVVVIAILIMKRGIKYVFLIILFMGIHSLRDDAAAFFVEAESKGVSVIVLFSQFLFLVENCSMILLFYFDYYAKTWYSLPVTVCVCVFSVLGSTMRIYLFRWLRKKSDAVLPFTNTSDMNT